MSYRDQQRLTDIASAITAIGSHLERGGLSDGLIFDAVRIRLLEIGEAVKSLPADLLSTEPGIPWKQVAAMRDHLAPLFRHEPRGAECNCGSRFTRTRAGGRATPWTA